MISFQVFFLKSISCHLQSKIPTFQIFFLDFFPIMLNQTCQLLMLLVMRTQARYLVLYYEVQTCFPTLLHLLAARLGHFRKKNLKRKSKMMIIGIDDRGLCKKSFAVDNERYLKIPCTICMYTSFYCCSLHIMKIQQFSDLILS